MSARQARTNIPAATLCGTRVRVMFFSLFEILRLAPGHIRRSLTRVSSCSGRYGSDALSVVVSKANQFAGRLAAEKTGSSWLRVRSRRPTQGSSILPAILAERSRFKFGQNEPIHDFGETTERSTNACDAHCLEVFDSAESDTATQVGPPGEPMFICQRAYRA